MKKMLLLFTVAFSFIATNLQAQFTTRWEKSASTSVDAAPAGLRWLLTTGDRASSMAYNKATGNLLVAIRGTSAVAPVNPTIVVLNAATGDSITSLNVTGIPAIAAGLQHNFQKVRVDDNGVIYAISLCLTSASNTPTNTAILRVLRWANQTATPTECARFNVTERVGDAFGLSGTGTNTILYASGNATLGTAPNATANIYALTTADGLTFNTINTITLQVGAAAHWGRGALEPVTNSLTSDIWIKASSQPARRITIAGTAPNFTATAAFTTADGTGNGQFANTFSQMGFLTTPDGKKYLAGCSGAAVGNTLLFKMINITSEVSPADVGTDNLTNTAVANNNASGDAAFKANGDGTYDIFYLSSNNGVKCITTVAALPVTLTNFSAAVRNQAAQLSWTTLSETNNQGFEVQKSIDGTNFSTIGFVASKAANGNSSNTLDYGFEDKNVASGKSYYRLKQVDKDGKFSISATQSVELTSNTSFAIKALQNPVQSNMVLNVKSNINRVVNINITNVGGATIYSKQFNVAAGENNFTIAAEHLPKGNLFVTVADAANSVQQHLQILKQ
jgi:hypothetical protein